MLTKVSIILVLCFYLEGCNCKEKILLDEVRVLTLHKDRLTNSRRSQPIPQLQCTGGSANCASKYLPSVVQCKNMGTDGFSAQWKCQAEMPSNVKFGHIDVNCEGYNYPNDEYILVGSCGLRYTLDKISGKSGRSGRSSKSYYSDNNDKSYSMKNLAIIIGFVIFCIVIYYSCLAPQEHVSRPSAPSYTGPPPPGFRSEFMTPGTPPPPYEESVPKTERTSNEGGGNWMWMLGGAALGYLFGSRGTGTQHYTPTSPYTEYHTGYSTRRDFSGYTDDRSSSSSRDSDGGSYRTSSGFGGTSRR